MKWIIDFIRLISRLKLDNFVWKYFEKFSSHCVFSVNTLLHPSSFSLFIETRFHLAQSWIPVQQRITLIPSSFCHHFPGAGFTGVGHLSWGPSSLTWLMVILFYDKTCVPRSPLLLEHSSCQESPILSGRRTSTCLADVEESVVLSSYETRLLLYSVKKIFSSEVS